VRALFAVCCTVCACGRIDFDPIAPAGDARTGDGIASGSDAARDTTANACSFAIPVQLNVRKAMSTCVGRYLIAGCGPSGTQEVVFAFTAPATNGYQFQAYDPGTMNVSNSTAQLDSTCTVTAGSCACILAFSVNAGDTVYLVVEAAAGGCTNIEFEAT